MLHDQEQANERSRLLLDVPSDRRVSAIQQEEDARSILSSNLSKEEQALSSTPIGERLPYNDYTTIDWLHDLVGFRCLIRTNIMADDERRSKIPAACEPFILAEACDIDCCLASTLAKDGSLQLLSAFLLLA